jgi:hypothetical protein
LAGVPDRYVVEGRSAILPTGAMETQPAIQHSCGSAAGDYADPAVRIAQLIKSFGPNGVFESICANDLGPAMQSIGHAMVGMTSTGMTAP